MSSTYGENLRLTIFGQSHSPAIGMTLEGFPAGFAVDPEALQRFLLRRAPGQSELSTPRKEADRPEFLSGLFAGRTCGAPIAVTLRNTNIRPGDYAGLQNTPRPGHADYTAQIKYFGFQDPTGGGHFSGRLTAPLCVAGGLCLQYLRQQGVEILSRIASIGGISDEGALLASTADKPFPTVSDARGEEMRRAILQAKAEGDSLGGVVECAVLGLPAGLGDPMFDGMENRIAAAVQKKTGMETRVCIPGHMQRGGSPSAYDRVLATQFGSYAAKLVEIERYGVTVALLNGHVTANRLEDIAGKTRNVPEGCELLTVARRMGVSLG